MIPTLDNTASEIVQYQRDSTVQRKDLAQKTKDFRKLEDSAKLGEIKGLLKGGSKLIEWAPQELTTLPSISNLHRPSHEPLEIYKFGFSTGLFLVVRSPRPVSLT